jgi:hypothetical protein
MVLWLEDDLHRGASKHPCATDLTSMGSTKPVEGNNLYIFGIEEKGIFPRQVASDACNRLPMLVALGNRLTLSVHGCPRTRPRRTRTLRLSLWTSSGSRTRGESTDGCALVLPESLVRFSPCCSGSWSLADSKERTVARGGLCSNRGQGMPRRRERRGSRVPRHSGAHRGTAPCRAARPAAFFCHPSAV